MITTTRATGLAAAAAIVGIALSGCAASAPGDDGQQLTTVRFGIPTQMGANNSPMAVAKAMGYFEAEGLQVELVHTTDATSIIQGVDSGSLELGSTPPEPLLQAIEQGSDVTLVYNYIRRQTGSVASLADGPIQELEDLEGGIVGQASLGTSNLLLSNGILASVGLKEDVDFTNLAVGTGAAALQALKTGQVQALSLWDTEYAAFEASGVELNYFTTEDVASLFSTTYFTSPDYLEEHADTVAGFGRAVAKATLFTATNPEAALRIMYESYPNTLLAGSTADEQLKTDIVALQRRVELLTAGDPQDTGTWGAYAPDAVAAWEKFAAEAGIVTEKIALAPHVTDEYEKTYNDFDANVVIADAEGWSVE
ncbi:ABC transporter substrate-binding protein [Phycicoccus sp. BSK3Z-2]|uniref:Thiamine pyrimidine synthase n=1 Tax=Phycicoccus avicenniae TaxID=2828860 RepID=A0A941D645_9MICO|nr:ABC transporter substrate-binding protein [Phycicoccus avicenniae]MBR7741828.1 ABC transporter substrate-binding protein [Phycicoccus avicenniae]